MKRLACKFSVKWIVREADIKNRFLEKYTPSSTRENHHKRQPAKPQSRVGFKTVQIIL